MNKKLSDVKISETFKVAGMEFIKFSEENEKCFVVSKDILFNMRFGNDNNFANSKVRKRLEEETLPKIEREIGAENLLEFETDLLSLDGSEKFGKMKSKISLPIFDFYRNNVKIFDKNKVNSWWWLATPDTTSEHYNDDWVVCVSPRGYIGSDYSFCSNRGGRPILLFKSSIFVSCEE